MTTAVFDTLKVSRDLKASGIEEAHAKAIVTAMAGAFEDTVATKADIAELRASTTSDLAEVRAELKQDIVNLKAEVFRGLWVQGAGIVGIQLAIAALLFAAIRFWS